MKTTTVTTKDESGKIKAYSFNGFWKEKSLLNFCNKRGIEPIEWHHYYITAKGVSEICQGDFIKRTNHKSFRDYL